jgi:hypothetical protein
MSDIPLKPCPFCGCNASMMMDVNVLYHDRYIAFCNNPSCRMQSPAMIDARDAETVWNNRVRDE